MSRQRPSHQPGAVLTRTQLDAIESPHGRLSLVERVCELVKGRIESRQLGAGQRLPSVRQLAGDCGVSADTVARAYDKLVASGRLESRAGSGFYVRQSERPHHAEGRDGRAHAEAMLAGWWRLRPLLTMRPSLSATGSGVLPADWLDEGTLGGALRTVSRASQRGLADYGDPQGYLPLRQQIQSKLKEMHIDVPPARIMITGGATEAIHLIMMGHLREPGEFVLLDDPGPFLLRDRLLASGLDMACVPRLADGPDLEVLRQLCIKHKPRFYFISSVLHNPTSDNMAPHKAFQLLRMAEEFDFTIVEDDTYGDLAQPGSSTTRMATLDQLNRVIYIGSFSKTLGAGLRVGYVAASPRQMEWLTVYRIVSGIAGSALPQRLVYQLLSQGGYRHHCAQLRARLDQHRQTTVEQLRQIGCVIDHIPEAGMFLWGRLPGGVNATRVAEAMYQAGHVAAPGQMFGSERYYSHMRFNIATTRDSPGLPLLAQFARELAPK
nr:PLP-dependent aminotransferase family protein [uncultured Duganella sp.]